jgi:hypothetical protein
MYFNQLHVFTAKKMKDKMLGSTVDSEGILILSEVRRRKSEGLLKTSKFRVSRIFLTNCLTSYFPL